MPKVKMGLSGVLDRPAKAFGTVSRYSAQILICFFSIHFPIFNSSVGWIPCNAAVPSVVVDFHQNGATHQTIKSPSFARVKAQQDEITLWNLCHRTGETDRSN